MTGDSDHIVDMAGKPLGALPQEKTQSEQPSPDSPQEKSSNAPLDNSESKPPDKSPEVSNPPPGGGKPFGPGMRPPIEYPTGMKRYSIIAALYLAGFLTALVGEPKRNQIP